MGREGVQGNAQNARNENPSLRITRNDFGSTCVTCWGWVPPERAIYTDVGAFHDHIRCLTNETYEALVKVYGCQGHENVEGGGSPIGASEEQASPTRLESSATASSLSDYLSHLQQEWAEDNVKGGLV